MPQPSAPWPELFVLGAFAATLLLTAGVAIRARAKKQAYPLLKKAPGPKWGFDSWATTATAVGAILGTVLGGATLPETPGEIDKQTLVALNLLSAASSSSPRSCFRRSASPPRRIPTRGSGATISRFPLRAR